MASRATAGEEFSNKTGFSLENANSSEVKCFRETYRIQWTSSAAQARLQAGFLPARPVGCLEAWALRVRNSRTALPCRLPCSQGPQGFLKLWAPLFYPGLSSQLCKNKTKSCGNAGWSVSTRPCISRPNFTLDFASSAVILLIFHYRFLPNLFSPYTGKTYIYFFLNACFILKQRKFSIFFFPQNSEFPVEQSLSLNQFYSAHSCFLQPLMLLILSQQNRAMLFCLFPGLMCWGKEDLAHRAALSERNLILLH